MITPGLVEPHTGRRQTSLHDRDPQGHRRIAESTRRETAAKIDVQFRIARAKELLHRGSHDHMYHSAPRLTAAVIADVARHDATHTHCENAGCDRLQPLVH